MIKIFKFLFLSNALVLACCNTERHNGLSSWVLGLKQRLHRLQSIAIENFKNIDDMVNYTVDTPRDYDLRLPYIMEGMPTVQQLKTDLHPTEPKELGRIGALLSFFLNRGNGSNQMRLARLYKKLQDTIPMSMEFPCKLQNGRSKTRPTSVHKLRPGDIDVVVALGDSITAGSLITATDGFLNSVENRGLSAFGGGQGDWREFLTLPNILKLFNGNLYGYATGDVNYGGKSKEAALRKSYNLAVAAAITDDLPLLIQTAVEKMKRDQRINFEEDWKMYTIFIGTVDQCSDICYWKRPQEAINHMTFTLDRAMTYLMNNSPRTLVNFVSLLSPHNYIKYMTGLSEYCKDGFILFCECSRAITFKNVSAEVFRLTDRFIQAQKTLLEDSKYQQKDDFAIVVQPIFEKFTVPKIKTPRGETTDFRLLSPDCFHISQRGNAFVAKELWNSLMSRPGEKKISYNASNLLEGFLCPTEDRPYIATLLNSNKNK